MARSSAVSPQLQSACFPLRSDLGFRNDACHNPLISLASGNLRFQETTSRDSFLADTYSSSQQFLPIPALSARSAITKIQMVDDQSRARALPQTCSVPCYESMRKSASATNEFPAFSVRLCAQSRRTTTRLLALGFPALVCCGTKCHGRTTFAFCLKGVARLAPSGSELSLLHDKPSIPLECPLSKRKMDRNLSRRGVAGAGAQRMRPLR